MISSKNPLIYIVDDDMSFRRMIDAFLKQNRLTNIKQFPSGEEMLEHFAKEPSEIVVQDYELGVGKLNGLEIFKKAKEIKPQIDFIFLSGQNDINTVVEIIKSGAFDYVVKDDTAKDNLLNRIKKLVFQKRLQQNQKLLKNGIILFACILTIALLICYFIGVRIVVY